MSKYLGIDVGSTTVKAAVIDENNNIIYKSYVRHFSKVKETVLSELDNIKTKFGGEYDVSKCEHITLSDAGCTTDSRNVAIEGSRVTITGEGDYLVSGSLSDGMITVDLSSIRPMIAMPFHPSNTYTIEELNANLDDILNDVEKRAAV